MTGEEVKTRTIEAVDRFAQRWPELILAVFVIAAFGTMVYFQFDRMDRSDERWRQFLVEQDKRHRDERTFGRELVESLKQTVTDRNTLLADRNSALMRTIELREDETARMGQVEERLNRIDRQIMLLIERLNRNNRDRPEWIPE